MSDKMICPVCGKTEFREKHNNDICGFCGWENDYFLEEGGANVLSLSEYQKRYHIYVYLNPEYTWETDGHPELTVKDLCVYGHQYSISNKQSVLSSDRCGCFFCQKIFESNMISETYINDKNGETAICPFCGVDAILPDSKVDLSEALLEDMYKVWFT